MPFSDVMVESKDFAKLVNRAPPWDLNPTLTLLLLSLLSDRFRVNIYLKVFDPNRRFCHYFPDLLLIHIFVFISFLVSKLIFKRRQPRETITMDGFWLNEVHFFSLLSFWIYFVIRDDYLFRRLHRIEPFSQRFCKYFFKINKCFFGESML